MTVCQLQFCQYVLNENMKITYIIYYLLLLLFLFNACKSKCFVASRHKQPLAKSVKPIFYIGGKEIFLSYFCSHSVLRSNLFSSVQFFAN